jgi:ketosteroid isomerase-like protein
MPNWPDDAEYHGHDGQRKLTRQWEESFDDFAFVVVDVRDAGDSVVALLEITGRVKGAGLPVQTPVGAVFSDFSGHMASDVRYFTSWQDALEAAGLS